MRKNLGALLKKYHSIYKKAPESRIFALLADLYRQKRDLKKALSLCEEGLKQHPSFSAGLIAKALILRDLGHRKECAEILEKAIKLAPESLLAHSLLGQIYLRMRDHVNTLKAYKIVLSLDPGNIKARHIVQKLEPFEEAGKNLSPKMLKQKNKIKKLKNLLQKINQAPQSAAGGV